MKVELVSSINVDDLIEEQFYSSEKASSKAMNRRDFLKYCSVGSLGLVAPLSVTEDTQAAIPWALITAGISLLSLINDVWGSNEKVSGDITLVNDSHTKVSGDLELALMDEWDIDAFSKDYAAYQVPARKVQKYRFTNGPSASVSRNTNALCTARTRVDKKRYNGLLIRA